MNATFRNVLQKVLTSFIITEPDRRRCRIRRRRCLEMKKVLGWSEFALGCHAQTIRKKYRERERETSRKVTINNNIKRKKRMVHMHVKCMNM